MSLAEKVLELEEKYLLLRASIQGVAIALEAHSSDNSALEITARQLKEILEKDKLD
jgi:regulator of replication initiation timing